MSVPDLDELIADVDRTCPSTDWIERLTAAAKLATRLQNLGDELVTEFVEHARFHSCSWADVGMALGVSRQAAQQRFLAPHVEYSAEEFDEELQVAMRAVKQAAIAHRHNYIGTEHILLGIAAGPNAGTRLLDSFDVSVDALRTAVEARLALGASQAASRIAFTPYARKVVALAKEAADAREDPRIGCDHVLLGLARLGRGMAAEVLRDAGVTAEALDASEGAQ